MRYSCVIRHESENRNVKFLLVLKLLRGYVRTDGRTDGQSGSKRNFVPKNQISKYYIMRAGGSSRNQENFCLVPEPDPDVKMSDCNTCLHMSKY